jgi:hypothetical protein
MYPALSAPDASTFLQASENISILLSVTKLCVGGDLTCFIAERTDGESSVYVDVLTCGNGQWGGLGNNLFSNAQGNPVRVKNVSGLRECRYFII